MKKYFKFFVTASIFAASFAVAPLAFAGVSFAPDATTTPQPFTVSCGSYIDNEVFVDGGFYEPAEESACQYTLPTSGQEVELATYRGIPGSATLLDSDFGYSGAATTVTVSPIDFTPIVRGQDYFTVDYVIGTGGGDAVADFNSVNNYLSTGGDAPSGITIHMVQWKWGLGPITSNQITSDLDAPTTAQPFTVSCGNPNNPFTPFISGGFYNPSGSNVTCQYTLPALTDTLRTLEIYKGTLRNAVLVDTGNTANSQTTLFSLQNTFGSPQPGDNFFAASYDAENQAVITNSENFLEKGTSVVPDNLHVLAWKWGTSTAPTACTVNCNSNVMFLPGIEGSDLFDADGSTVWLPSSDAVADTLQMNPDGISVNEDITTLDAIGQANAGQLNRKIYVDFLSQMQGWQTTYGITATTTPYDWRLDYNTLLTNGRKLPNGHISYLEAPLPGHDPYLIETLKQLASTSPTGKVTIIAHSNGGLLAKALMEKLGPTETAELVDKVVLVAVPQIGAPQSIGALLNGLDLGIPNIFSFSGSTPTDAEARKLAQNMPSAYDLLPSTNYFTDVDNPVVTFDSVSLPTWITQYGDSSHPQAGIHSTELLQNFMTDNSGFRPTPAVSDLETPQIVNSTLFASSTAVHSSLDIWTPPTGVKLITIAGWGNETLAGIQYAKKPLACSVLTVAGCAQPSYSNEITYTPQITIDGDGTVPVPSALWADGASSTRYWINLDKYNCPTAFSCLPENGLVADIFRTAHADLFEMQSVRDLLSDIVGNSSTTTLPQFISATQPTYDGSEPRLHFILHSPLTLGFTDSSGNYTGSTATTTSFNVPGVDYERFGEVQWLSVPTSLAGQLVMHGTGSGSFTLDVQSVDGDATLATTTFAAVPTATSTIATMNISASVSPTSNGVLNVDFNGDGVVDSTLHAAQGAMVFPDTVPPELKTIFNTTTDLIGFIGSDDSGSTTVSTVTSSGTSQMGGTLYNATTTATDPSGNTATLAYTSFVQSGKDVVTLSTLAYNHGTSTAVTGKLQYMWQVQNGALSMLMSTLTTSTSTVQAQWHLNSNSTSIMVRQNGPGGQTLQTTLSGDVIPFLISRQSVINYGW